MILDTSALIELERAATHAGTLPLPRDTVLHLPAIVWAEALVGVRSSRGSQKGRRMCRS
jgi:predicted nucleic acid-binding protein